MARRAWLLFTPDMANEQALFLAEAVTLGRSLAEHVVCENELPNKGDGVPDYVQVGTKEARNGAIYLLLESPQFEDVGSSDYPLLPQPRLRRRDEWLQELRARHRNTPGSDKVEL